MKKFSVIIYIFMVIMAVSACEGCVNKAAKEESALRTTTKSLPFWKALNAPK